MRMMTAEQLIDELVRAICPPKGNVITLREFEPKWETDPNWISGTGECRRTRLSTMRQRSRS